MSHRTLRLIPMLGLVVLTNATVRAADTLEPFAIGATDVDFYLGFDGLGRERDSQLLSGDLMLGYGISERLSAFLGVALFGDGYMGNGQAGLNLGLYGTVLESPHLDLDLVLALEAGGEGFSAFGLVPGFELNLDLDEGMGSFGMYWRSLFGLTGRAASDPDQARSIRLEMSQTVGLYQTLADRHQILLEANVVFRPRSATERRMEVGGLALGYNLALSARIELIHEVFVDLPQGGERVAVGFNLGFIATLPAAGPI